MGQIDAEEAGFFLSTPEEQDDNRARGYVTGMDEEAPAVVSLNGQLATTAINEFAIMVSGTRDVSRYIDYDMLGAGRKVKSQWMSSVRTRRDPSCVVCALEGKGDDVDLGRYSSVRPAGEQRKTEAATRDK